VSGRGRLLHRYSGSIDWRKGKTGDSTTEKRTKPDPRVERLLQLVLEATMARRRVINFESAP
jgi:hypothetical protein